MSSINSLGVKLSQGEQRLSLSDLSPYFNNSSREFEIIGSTSDVSFVDNQVFNGTEYCYYVVASNVSGDSGASAQVCATPEGPPPLYPPEDLVASGQIGSIDLSWNEPQDFSDDGGSDDGGNDDGGNDGGGTTGGNSSCEDCEYDWSNYGSECCDTAWDEYGIDCATFEGVYYWDCSGCECPGDNGATSGGTDGGGGSGSCVGNCGSASDTCWCDDLCEYYGDCCSDYYDECRDCLLYTSPSPRD